ncbi:unnamed protein product [Pelagomonas calceolata]|uniref:Uncharacterized protein n=1 Tax=Pelagomonas calceolata TaxID=35677 RepID=A0A8J2WTR8_9STRA|nr:unnamed protein product [Pelagomonas calceolata]|mmetsp:Transcript_22760/g.59380  ORF Transcript_22760/g.59380 Transcript_22760/m.59380 type:complete len:223 (-) Transcript_22760:141-809(-)
MYHILQGTGRRRGPRRWSQRYQTKQRNASGSGGGGGWRCRWWSRRWTGGGFVEFFHESWRLTSSSSKESCRPTSKEKPEEVRGRCGGSSGGCRPKSDSQESVGAVILARRARFTSLGGECNGALSGGGVSRSRGSPSKLQVRGSPGDARPDRGDSGRGDAARESSVKLRRPSDGRRFRGRASGWGVTTGSWGRRALTGVVVLASILGVGLLASGFGCFRGSG